MTRSFYFVAAACAMAAVLFAQTLLPMRAALSDAASPAPAAAASPGAAFDPSGAIDDLAAWPIAAQR